MIGWGGPQMAAPAMSSGTPGISGSTRPATPTMTSASPAAIFRYLGIVISSPFSRAALASHSFKPLDARGSRRVCAEQLRHARARKWVDDEQVSRSRCAAVNGHAAAHLFDLAQGACERKRVA